MHMQAHMLERMMSCAMRCRLHAELHKEGMHYHVEHWDQSGMVQRRLLGLSAGASGLDLVEHRSKVA